MLIPSKQQSMMKSQMEIWKVLSQNRIDIAIESERLVKMKVVFHYNIKSIESEKLVKVKVGFLQMHLYCST